MIGQKKSGWSFAYKKEAIRAGRKMLKKIRPEIGN
jgi:hypothetical protein